MADERHGPEEGLGLLAILFGGIILLLLIASICLKTEPNQCAPGLQKCTTQNCGCGCCNGFTGETDCSSQCQAPFSVWNSNLCSCCQPKANPGDPDNCIGLQQKGQCAPPKISCDASLPGCAAVGGCCAGGYAWSDQQGCCATVAGVCQCPIGRECPQGNEKCPTDLAYGSCCASGYYWDSGRGCCWSNLLGECQKVCETGLESCAAGLNCPSGCCEANGCCADTGCCACSAGLNCPDGCCDSSGCCAATGCCPCPSGVDCPSGCCDSSGSCKGSNCFTCPAGVTCPNGCCNAQGCCNCPPGVVCPDGCCDANGGCMQTRKIECSSSLATYDLNGDCVVNKTDADQWMTKCIGGNTKTCSAPCIHDPNADCPPYDLNNDNVVNGKDYDCLCKICDCSGTLGWVCKLPGTCIPAA